MHAGKRTVSKRVMPLERIATHFAYYRMCMYGQYVCRLHSVPAEQRHRL